MRSISWVLGLALGMLIGGAALEAGILALLLLVPASVWAARERARFAGLGGLLVGLGLAVAGLLALANARCAASNQSGPDYSSVCVAPDLTPYFLVAAMVSFVGGVVSLLVVARGR